MNADFHTLTSASSRYAGLQRRTLNVDALFDARWYKSLHPITKITYPHALTCKEPPHGYEVVIVAAHVENEAQSRAQLAALMQRINQSAAPPEEKAAPAQLEIGYDQRLKR